jgi:hypothetical protein
MARKKEEVPVVDTNYYLETPILSSDSRIAVIGMDIKGDKVLYRYVANPTNVLWWDFTTDHREYSQYTAKGAIDHPQHPISQEFLPLAWAMYAKVQPEEYKRWISRKVDMIAELREDLNRVQSHCMPQKFNGFDVDEKGRSILGCLKALQRKADSKEVFGYGEVEIDVRVGAAVGMPDMVCMFGIRTAKKGYDFYERMYGIKLKLNIGNFDEAMDYLIDISCKKYLKIEEMRKL